MSIWMRSMLVALTLLPVACKKDDDSAPQTQSYITVDAGTLETAGSSIKGTGSVVYRSPLDSITSKDNFLITFSVDDGGSLELIAHSDSSLHKGVSVILTRSGTELTASLGGTATVLGGVDAASELTISIDVHNNETPAHIVIWGADGGEPLVNSEDAGADPGNGSGTAWGLALNKAQVSAAEVRKAQFEE